MKVSSLIFLLLFFSLNLTAQQSPLDSLLESIPDSRDSSHFDHLIDIANEINKTDREKALPYYHQARSIVESQNDIPRLANINKYIGVNHLYLANNDSSRYFLEKSSAHYLSLGDTLGIIGNNTNLALIHQRDNEIEEAVELYHKVISDSENIDEWIEVILAKVNLASLLIDQEDFDQGLNYLNSIDDDYSKFKIELARRIKNKSDKNLNNTELNKLIDANGDNQFILSNYPYIYINQGICYVNQSKLDTAIIFQNKAIDAAPDNAYVTSYAFHNLSEVYEKKENWREAYNNSREALAGFESINNVRGRTFSLNSLGLALSELGNHTAADTTLQSALALAKEINFKEEIRDAYKNIAKNFASKGDYNLAYENHLSFAEFKDSISSESRINAIQEWETKYETEKERDEVNRLAIENDFKTRSQRTQLILFIVGILSILGIGLYLYTRYRLKKEQEAAEYERATNQAMAKFVPMEFVKTLGKDNIRDVALGDEVEKEVTVLFSDIRNFSSMSERMTPIENFRFVKRYVERMSPIVHSNGGFINQYLGDGIMAIFQNDPDDALQACIEMQTATESFNEELKQMNQDPIRVGMGMHTGSLVMGIIGDENRQDAAIISDTVNSAARMESLTKSYGNKIVLSKSSIDRMKHASQFNIRGLGQAMVKGKSQPLDIYECYDADSPQLQSQKSSSTELFGKAVKAYYERDFQKSQELFEKLYSATPDDLVAYSFIKRIQNLGTQKSETTIPGVKYN